MIQREMPDTIFYECPVCDEETEHQILKGRMGKATIEGTFRCNSCGRVTSETIKIPELIEVRESHFVACPIKQKEMGF